VSLFIEHELALPPKPEGLAPQQQAREVAEWVNASLPYRKNDIYTIAEARQPNEDGEPRGGICFVQSLGAVALMQSWDTPSAVVLSRTHASSVGLFSDKYEEELLFIDPNVNVFPETVSKRIARYKAINLVSCYRDSIAQALENDKPFIQIYYQKYGEQYPWKQLVTNRINGHRLNRAVHTVHAIIDPQTAKKTLESIGELNDLARNNPRAHRRNYHRLARHIPEFYALEAVNYLADYND
jgi:hypothetical protein